MAGDRIGRRLRRHRPSPAPSPGAALANLTPRQIVGQIDLSGPPDRRFVQPRVLL